MDDELGIDIAMPIGAPRTNNIVVIMAYMEGW